jgi:hypothetical protein
MGGDVGKTIFSVNISKIWVSEWASFDRLMSHHKMFGDLKILVDGTLLKGTNPIATGEHSISLTLFALMRLRQFKEPPGEFVAEFVELSGYEYKFEYLVSDGEDVLMLSVMLDEEPVPGFKRIEFDLRQVQTELRRFRLQLVNLMLENCPEDMAARWWEGNALEEFNDSNNPKGKY